MGMALVCMLAGILWRSQHRRRLADLIPTEMLRHIHRALL